MSQYGHAGKSTREMAKNRYQKTFIYAGLFLLAGLLLLTNINNLARLGLPAVIIIFLALRIGADFMEKKALHLKKRAKDADRGAAAEEKVAIALGSLPEGYHGFHDIPFTGFNIDHVVIGPGGIFLIETKSHGGKVEAQGDTLLLNGRPPEKDFLKQAWSQTYSLKDFLWKQTSEEWEVKPVLCFSRAYVQLRRPVKGITIAGLKYLNTFLAKQPAVLGSDQVSKLSQLLGTWTTRFDERRERDH
jgi:hypothetical protein